MTDQKRAEEKTDQALANAEHGKKSAQQQGGATQNNVPKTESTSEYEGAADRQPTGNKPKETKTETSSSSGQ